MKEIIVNVDNYNENSIKTIEGDNLSEVYKIYICKNKRRIDLTNKIAVMAYVDEYGSKRSNILNLNITNASQGEIELPITNVISNENGVYACQIAIYGENNSLEQTAPFSLIVENNIFSKISNTAINSSDFHILSEAIKTASEYAKKLKDGTEKIELQYADKLNIVESGLTNFEKIPYLGTPFNFYIYNSNYAQGKVFISWDGNIAVPGGNLLNFDKVKEIFSLKLETSPEGKINCLTLKDGEYFVYDYVENNYKIVGFYDYKITKHKLLLNNISGNATKGYFCQNVNINNVWDCNLKEQMLFKKQKYNIENALSRVISKMDLNDDLETFAFITDVHQQEWNQGFYSMGMNIINRLMDKNLINFTLNAGDNILWASEKNVALANHITFSNRTKGDFFYAVGNHDCNGWDEKKPQPGNTFITGKELYNIYGKSFKNKVSWGSKEKMYYYFDRGKYLRIIVLNPQDVPDTLNSDGTRKYNPTQVFAFQQEQLNWLANVLLNSNGKQVLIVSHIPLIHHDDGMYCNYKIPYNNNVVKEMLEHFREGTRYTYNNTYDDATFNAKGDVNFTLSNRVICVLSGHIHYDCDIAINGIRHIARNCDYPVKWDNTGITNTKGMVPEVPERIIGDYSQYCFDIFNIDTYNCKVYMTRFGVGSDYWFSY